MVNISMPQWLLEFVVEYLKETKTKIKGLDGTTHTLLDEAILILQKYLKK